MSYKVEGSMWKCIPQESMCMCVWMDKEGKMGWEGSMRETGASNCFVQGSEVLAET